MNLQDFITKWNGQLVNSPHGILGQCVALSSEWAVENGWPELMGPTAYSIWLNFRDSAYQVVMNQDGDTSQYPVPGDIVFWKPPWGRYVDDSGIVRYGGHTAVVTEGTDGLNLYVFEQNDGDNGLAHAGEHNYTDVAGWFHPVNSEDQDVTTATNPDNGEVRDAQGWLNAYIERNRQWDADEKLIGQLQQQLADAQARVRALSDGQASQPSPALGGIGQTSPTTSSVQTVPTSQEPQLQLDPLSTLTPPTSVVPATSSNSPDLPKDHTSTDASKPVDKSTHWIATDSGKAVLSVVGAGLGWLAANVGLLPLQPAESSLLVVIAARLASDLQKSRSN